MTPNLRTMLVLVAALVVVGAVFRQDREVRRLRTVVAQLNSLSKDGAAADSTVNNPLAAEIEALRRKAAEVHRLRAEVTQLRREKVETAVLQARIDDLALEVSAIPKNQRPDYISIFDGFNPPPSAASPLVLQASSLAESSPEDAARWVASLPSGEEQDQAAMAVIDRWTDSNPVAAAAWTTQFAEGPLREQALSIVARQWGLRDWNATAGWLETLPTGSSRDAAIEAFVTSADGYDIELALDWANRMEDPESRTIRVEQTAKRWLNEDTASARTWIGEAQLPAGMAERLLSTR